MHHLDQALRNYQAGLDTRDNLEGYAEFCAILLKERGAAQWWQQTKTIFVKETYEYLDALLGDGSPRPSIGEIQPWYRPDGHPALQG